ncbi:MerR family transcriptional regulator [Lactiplantibacillus pingfangensis]|uniref:MerR family transcriptional regulator n=1 Tax=Lactiplantibacillus pingfangensis TaxID=2559915 RepID=UPI0010F965B1|nr:MerR family transcriptional regulator [Lactiplantibacillus pingfangensis]
MTENNNHSDKNYPIGEFATINHISARMLRHYDKIALFKPKIVLANGYRYYASDQIPTVALIKRYQACGFTLAEIKTLLDASDAKIKAMAKAKQLQLAQQDIAQDKADELILKLLGSDDDHFPNEYVVATTQQPERQLVCSEPLADESKIDAAFDQLYRRIDNADIKPMGLPMLLSGAETALYQAAVPVQSNDLATKLTPRVLPSGSYLSTMHYGDYDSIGAAYDCLLREAEQRQQVPVWPFIERYFLDQTYTTTPNDYITEISIKVTP